jgi:hypothetical protein
VRTYEHLVESLCRMHNAGISEYGESYAGWVGSQWDPTWLMCFFGSRGSFWVQGRMQTRCTRALQSCGQETPGTGLCVPLDRNLWVQQWTCLCNPSTWLGSRVVICGSLGPGLPLASRILTVCSSAGSLV